MSSGGSGVADTGHGPPYKTIKCLVFILIVTRESTRNANLYCIVLYIVCLLLCNMVTYLKRASDC